MGQTQLGALHPGTQWADKMNHRSSRQYCILGPDPKHDWFFSLPIHISITFSVFQPHSRFNMGYSPSTRAICKILLRHQKYWKMELITVLKNLSIWNKHSDQAPRISRWSTLLHRGKNTKTSTLHPREVMRRSFRAVSCKSNACTGHLPGDSVSQQKCVQKG